MSEIRVLVADDEPPARRGLLRLLQQEQDIKVVGEARNGREAVQLIAELRPQVAFLDIQMPELNGLEVVQALDDDELPIIVFVTAYDEWAVRAFELQALDYILKPYEDDRLRAVVQRVRTHLAGPDHRTLVERVRQMLSSQQPAAYLTRLIVREAGVVQFVQLEQVTWIEAADYYVRLHLGGKTQLVRYSLNELERQLDPRRFVRVHRSAIVSTAAVKEIHVAHQNHHQIVLKDGTKVPLSRGKKDELEEVLSRTQ